MYKNNNQNQIKMCLFWNLNFPVFLLDKQLGMDIL